MLEHWVLAFIVASVVALVATPTIARLAAPKRGSTRVPVATALAIVAGTLAGAVVVIADADTELVVGMVTALWLGYAGQLTENGLLPRVVRWLAIPAGAVALVVGGLRLEITGTAAGDITATVLVIWLAISAWRSAPTRDNLLLSWGTVIAAGAGLTGGLAGQVAVAGIAAATVGACTGFFPYVLPPIAARLRSGGGQFLGCMVVVLALDAHVAVAPPAAAVVPLLLLALPLVDGVLVGAARLRDRSADAMDAGLAGQVAGAGHPASHDGRRSHVRAGRSGVPRRLRRPHARGAGVGGGDRRGRRAAAGVAGAVREGSVDASAVPAAWRSGSRAASSQSGSSSRCRRHSRCGERAAMPTRRPTRCNGGSTQFGPATPRRRRASSTLPRCISRPWNGRSPTRSRRSEIGSRWWDRTCRRPGSWRTSAPACRAPVEGSRPPPTHSS